MKLKNSICLLLVGLFTTVQTLGAIPEHHHPAGNPEDLGKVSFSISCGQEAQKDFNRAIAALHSFWYQESIKAFEAITKKEPSCAMAYWGIAISHFQQIWSKPQAEAVKISLEALEKAKNIGQKTDRELRYIHILEQFYRNDTKKNYIKRLQNYENSMADLYKFYPDDSEVAIFYALSLLATAYSSPPDRNYMKQKKGGAILEEIFKTQPNHPGIAHYIIHSYDYPELAANALEAAKRYAIIAPDSPHALHMPSHIFTRLGYWQDSISSNIAAAASAHKYQWIGEELHAMDYLVYAYMQAGQYHDAKKVVDKVPGILATAKDKRPAYASSAMGARYTVERRAWKEAANLIPASNLFRENNWCYMESPIYFARGLGAAHLKNIKQAELSITELEYCRDILLKKKTGKTDAGSLNESRWAALIDAQKSVISARLMLLKGETKTALKIMRAAADMEDSTDKPTTMPGAISPARELLGDMLVELGYQAEALPEYQLVLEISPLRFRSLYGAAKSAESIGNIQVAKKYYSQLVKVSQFSKVDISEITHARDFLEKQSLAVITERKN